MGGLMLLSASCTDYLDRPADSELSEKVAFQNFNNFQGFIEEIYNCIPDKESCFWCTTFNWGEDEIMNAGNGDSHFSHQMDLGNLRDWLNNDQTYMGGTGRGVDPASVAGNGGDKFNHRIWGHAYYCIRKCNLGIANIELFAGTTEERNLLLGQLYFFRAWWHNELMQYLGGVAYVDEVLDGATKLELPRMSYRECADKAIADFAKAAELLPSNWEQTGPGKNTINHNQARVTSVAALAYAGKVALWAASPLMAGDPEALAPSPAKVKSTYSYDTKYADMAANYLGQALKLANDPSKTTYALAQFNYSDVYKHTETSTDQFNYHEIFYTTGQNWMCPGGTETVFRGPCHEGNGTNWNFAKLWGSKVNGLVEHDVVIHMPTANYVNYAYGMANGLALTDPESGFDPAHPFLNRDPRFYHDIIFDGERYVVTTIEDDDDAFRYQQYADFQTGSPMRVEDVGSRSGYFCQKLNPKQSNKFDGFYNWSTSLQCYLPYMRLADVYLMYAEAVVAAGKGADGTAGGMNLTAVEAINTLRNRVGCAEVADKEKSGDALMEMIRRERACELAFEGLRWNDLQRWGLLDKAPYNKKTSQEFTRAMENITNKFGIVVENEWYKDNDPAEAEVKGWSEKLICNRNLEAKHYWFPWPDSEIYLYEGFMQNPGW